ncbi:MAG: alpha/beta hydrolase [Sulfuricaulis sp.]|uniref:alpha/beta hydrolase n=1 Tax=Sulfuricaulis sp. TaxID=2003553 RepID=UPI0025EF1573|nr:alpha/beta hydrolase [Sulfuricaulis sp.]MCR4347970.1 alpha/beta hydrolase [Sulfuricaulis sp.]
MRRLLVIGFFSLSLLGCSNVFFFPYQAHVQTPKQLGLVYEDVYFNASDGTRLHGWFLPAQGNALGTILFLHGNAENISTHIMSVRWLPARGFNVFLLDYRGYGASEGKPTFGGAQDDVESALKMLTARPGVDVSRIVVFGQSLGGAIAVYRVAHTAYRENIRALVVESAFSGYRQITREKLADFWLTWPFQYPLSWTVSDEYNPSTAVANISPIPLLIIHGDQDPIVPLHHGQRLFELAREPKQLWVVPGGGHTQAFQKKEYRDRLVAYLTEILTAAPAAHR